jgi:uncharacterized protein Usg
MSHDALSRQLQGFSLTTAEILYRLPDFPRLLQSYVWQDYDVAPNFPKLVDFLDYWAANLDGPLYRIRVAHRRLIAPQEFKFVQGGTLWLAQRPTRDISVKPVTSPCVEIWQRATPRTTTSPPKKESPAQGRA